MPSSIHKAQLADESAGGASVKEAVSGLFSGFSKDNVIIFVVVGIIFTIVFVVVTRRTKKKDKKGR
jgi:F0F1-type ATP synthase membrane subunit a